MVLTLKKAVAAQCWATLDRLKGTVVSVPHCAQAACDSSRGVRVPGTCTACSVLDRQKPIPLKTCLLCGGENQFISAIHTKKGSVPEWRSCMKKIYTPLRLNCCSASDYAEHLAIVVRGLSSTDPAKSEGKPLRQFRNPLRKREQPELVTACELTRPVASRFLAAVRAKQPSLHSPSVDRRSAGHEPLRASP
jgi:hypothetical protein